MTTSNNFNEYYKTISDTELLHIMDNPQDYQPMAVEAAKVEIFKRQLSDTEIQKARQPLIDRKIQLQKEKDNLKAFETKVRSAGQTFIKIINPIQAEIPSADKSIRLLVILFSCIFLYQVVNDFKFLILMLKDIPRFDTSSFFYFLPYVIIPIATILLWKRKPLGWVLLSFFVTYSLLGVFWMILQDFGRTSSSLTMVDNLFPRPAPWIYFIQLVFLGSTLYVLCKTSIREVFKIQSQKMTITLVISVLLTIFLIFGIS